MCRCALFMASQIMGSTMNRITSFKPTEYRGEPLTFRKPIAKMYVKPPGRIGAESVSRS
jgi:hypothetical protein